MNVLSLSEDTGSIRIGLLRQTVKHAVARSSYYRNMYARHDLDLQSLDAFRRLPLLSPQALTASGRDILTEGTLPEYVGITSGSTFGKTRKTPLFIYHGDAERTARMELQSVLESISGDGAADSPLVLKLMAANHGLTPSLPMKGCFALPLEKFYHFQAILTVLRDRFAFPGWSPRVRVLTSSLNLVKLLTLLCIENNVTSDEFDIQMVACGGWQLTTRWRRIIEDFWRAPTVEFYGLSEVPGLMARRDTPNAPFILSPAVYGEILGVDNDEPVSHGLGRLVATAYYPMATSMPMIRYDTQDVVDVTGYDDQTGQPMFEFLGRKQNVVFAPNTCPATVALAPLATNDILDGIADIGIRNNPRATHVPLNLPFGWPKYRLGVEDRDGHRAVSLDLELHWSPVQFPARADELKTEIRGRILERSPNFAVALALGSMSLDLSFSEPGSTSYSAVM